LYDSFGRLVLQSEINSTAIIDTRNLAIGFYELKTFSENGASHFSKMEIIHQ